MALTPEQIKELEAKNSALEAENATLKAAADKTKQHAASLQHLVKPHADMLRQCASNMMAAGIGADSGSGHATVLNKMADHMEAESVLGRVPSTFNSYHYARAEASASQAELQASIDKAVKEATDKLKDEISSLTTKVSDAEKKATDLAAAASGKTAEQIALEAAGGQRKSLHPTSIALIKKIGLDATASNLSVAVVDEACRKAGLVASDSMALKLNLKAAGVIAA